MKVEGANEYEGIEFSCPFCERSLSGYHPRCPHCGEELDESFCAVYRPKSSPFAKIIAYVMLAAMAVVIIIMAVALLH